MRANAEARLDVALQQTPHLRIAPQSINRFAATTTHAQTGIDVQSA
jgi:hypothetical protein